MKLENNPFKLNTWNQLKTYKKSNNDSFLDLVHQNRRNNTLQFKVGHLNVDLTRNYLDEKVLDFLIDWSNEMQVSNMLTDLLNGEIVNDSEERSAVHPHCRDFSKITSGEQCFNSSIDTIKHFYNQIVGGKWTTHKGESFKNILSIGIGGSDVGLDFVINSIPSLRDNILKVDFLNHIDPLALDGIMSSIDLEETLFIVVSKSFTTQETILNAQVLKDLFINQFGEEAFRKHFLAITANVNEAMSFGIEKDKILSFREDLGGRFSLWGTPGLVIALNWGIEHFIDFLKGGHLIDLHIQQSILQENLPLHMALLSIYYAHFYDAKQEVVIPYQEHLTALIPYLQQVAMESNGKSVNKKGEKIDYDTVNVLWGGMGNKAQHTFFQWLHQGTHFTPIDMIFVKDAKPKWPLQYEMTQKSYLAQIEALTYGTQKFQEYFKEHLIEKEDTFLKHTYSCKGGVPVNQLYIEQLCPSSIGELMALYEYKYIIQGHLLNINSFDQFGVELGKFISKNIALTET